MTFRDAARILYPTHDVSGPEFNESACNCSRYETCDFCKDVDAKEGIEDPDATLEAYYRPLGGVRTEDETC